MMDVDRPQATRKKLVSAHGLSLYRLLADQPALWNGSHRAFRDLFRRYDSRQSSSPRRLSTENPR